MTAQAQEKDMERLRLLDQWQWINSEGLVRETLRLLTEAWKKSTLEEQQALKKIVLSWPSFEVVN